MSASAERINEALRIVRATLGTQHEQAARADLAVQVAAARKEQQMVYRSRLKCDHPGCDRIAIGIGRGVDLDAAKKAARRAAVVLAEKHGWYVSPHGATLDLCDVHRHLAVRGR